MADENGWRLAERYRVLDRLGAGSMADVFRAHDEQLDRDVAVKVFRTAIEGPGNADTPERRARELHALAQLSHPHLITLYDASPPGASPSYLVTELVSGPSLAARLADGPLPESLVRVVGAQIADALDYVHALGMVHRDVKPGNILLGSAGPEGSDPETSGIRARLSDFGIVRLVNSARLTAADFTLGTASYLAPEQARGSAVDQGADIYSLGLVLLEALTGRRSFGGSVHEALAARLTHAPEIPPELPAPWPGLLAAMTSADPAMRPSAAAVAGALRADVAAPAVVAMPPAPLVPPAVPVVVPPPDPVTDPQSGVPSEPPARRRNAAGMAAAALACAAIVAGGAVLLFRPAGHPEVRPGSGQTVPSSSSVPSSGSRGGATNNPVAVVNERTPPPTDAHGVPVKTGQSSATSGAGRPSGGGGRSGPSAPASSSSSASTSPSAGGSSSASQSSSSSSSPSASQSSSASQSPSPSQSSNASQSPSPSASSSASSSSSGSSTSSAPQVG